MILTRRNFLRLAGSTIAVTAGTVALGQKEKLSLFPEYPSLPSEVGAPMPRFVWNPEYSFSWAQQFPYSFIKRQHISPVEKFERLYQRLLAEGVLQSAISSSPALAREDFILVHTAEYLNKLEDLADSWFGFGGLLNPDPINQQIIDFAKAACAGTYFAALSALQRGRSMNLSGGFHHAFPDHEEGFCYLNDVAIAIKKLQQEGRVKKVMIVDGDVHHGNGNAFIFRDDSSVFIFDIYQQDLYPAVKIPTNVAIALSSADYIDDLRYNRELQNQLQPALESYKPDILFYLNGADPLATDQLGGFQLTPDGLFLRDQHVIEATKKMGIPTTVVLAGGYSPNLDDVVNVHYECAKLIQLG